MESSLAMNKLVISLKKFWGSAAFPLLFGLVGVFSVEHLIPVSCRIHYSIGFLPIAIFLLFTFFASRCRESFKVTFRDRQSFVASACFAFLLSVALSVGSFSIEDEVLPLKSINFYVWMIINGAVITFLISPIWNCLNCRNKTHLFSNRFLVREKGSLSIKKQLAIFAFIVICWTPVYLAAYPGFFMYDVGGSSYITEWNQYASGNLNSHHPVLHTLILGFVISTIASFSDFNAGVAVFTALQAILFAFVFTKVINTISRVTTNRIIFLVALLFPAFNPVIPMFACCATKDVLFSAMVLLFIVQFINIAKVVKKHYRTSIISLIILSCLGFFVCALRSNGLYAFAIFIPIAIICMKNYRKQIASCLLISLLASLAWLYPVADILNVQSGKNHSIDAMAVPVQQLAYTYSSGALSDTEKNMLKELNYQAPTNYWPTLSDPSRYTFENMSLSEIANAYVKIGFYHPGTYMTALIQHTQSAWNPYSYSNTYNGTVRSYDEMETSFFPAVYEAPSFPDSKIPSLLEQIQNIGRNLYLQGIPLIALFVSLPFYVWLVALAFIRTIEQKKWLFLPLITLLLLLMASTLIAPGMIPRYFLPEMVSVPLLLLLVFTDRSEVLEKDIEATI